MSYYKNYKGGETDNMSYFMNTTIMTNRMRKQRKYLEYSTDKVASEANIKPDTYRRYEKGTRVPPIDVLCDVADALQCDIDYLTGKIPLPTYEATDIQAQTALSEEAINILTCDNFPEFETAEGREFYRIKHLQEQGAQLSWFIEHGLISQLSEYDRYLSFSSSTTSSFNTIPHDLQTVLQHAFDVSCKIAYTERPTEYKNRIAESLISLGIDKVKDIFTQIHDNKQYKNSDFEDIALYNSEGKFNNSEHTMIQETALILFDLSYQYFESKYELPLYIQDTTNKINTLLRQYATMKTGIESEV